jgi:hypothetical protein
LTQPWQLTGSYAQPGNVLFQITAFPLLNKSSMACQTSYMAYSDGCDASDRRQYGDNRRKLSSRPCEYDKQKDGDRSEAHRLIDFRRQNAVTAATLLEPATNNFIGQPEPSGYP